MTSWLTAGGLLLAAVPVVWPRRSPRWRLRRVTSHRRGVARRWSVGGWCRGLRDTTHPRTTGWQVLVVATLVVFAAVFGGVVAAVIAGGYGVVGLRGLARRARQRRTATHRREALDRLGAAAADLRAGLPVAQALAASSATQALGGGRSAALVSGGGSSMARASMGGSRVARALGGGGGSAAQPPDDRVGMWVGAATRLAERTGAPLAELLERVEADARARDRAHAAAAAQAAGAVATAWLLAALPLAGIGLGYAIGADPLRVLLHTPVGAGCAVVALLLQLAGLAWSRRIIRPGDAAGAAA